MKRSTIVKAATRWRALVRAGQLSLPSLKRLSLGSYPFEINRLGVDPRSAFSGDAVRHAQAALTPINRGPEAELWEHLTRTAAQPSSWLSNLWSRIRFQPTAGMARRQMQDWRAGLRPEFQKPINPDLLSMRAPSVILQHGGGIGRVERRPVDMPVQRGYRSNYWGTLTNDVRGPFPPPSPFYYEAIKRVLSVPESRGRTGQDLATARAIVAHELGHAKTMKYVHKNRAAPAVLSRLFGDFAELSMQGARQGPRAGRLGVLPEQVDELLAQWVGTRNFRNSISARELIRVPWRHLLNTDRDVARTIDQIANRLPAGPARARARSAMAHSYSNYGFKPWNGFDRAAAERSTITKAASFLARAHKAVGELLAAKSTIFRPGQVEDLARAMRFRDTGWESRALGMYRQLARSRHPFSKADIDAMRTDLLARLEDPSSSYSHVQNNLPK